MLAKYVFPLMKYEGYVGLTVAQAGAKNDEFDGYYGDGRYVDDDCRYDDRYARYW